MCPVRGSSISTARKSVGRQAEARMACVLMASPANTRILPDRTLVAQMNRSGPPSPQTFS